MLEIIRVKCWKVLKSIRKKIIISPHGFFLFFVLAALGLRCCVLAFSSCGVRASHCGGFSYCGARALGAWASVVVARGLSSCGTWAQ